MEKINYCRQSIDSSDVEAVSAALQADLITRGPQVKSFEQAVASYCGAEYAVAFNSGTTALMAACYAAKLSPHDRVLTTPNTFLATVSAPMAYKAVPVFIDIDRNSGNFDLKQLEMNLPYETTRGRNVIMPVHFAGIPVDMEEIDRMIVGPNNLIIEDAAHAIGSSYKDGRKVGSCAYSAMTMFSFHPAKTITTGEGGMITTNDPALYEELLKFRNNGQALVGEPWFHPATDITGNFNFTEMQAALGLSQLKRLDSFVLKRRELMTHYRNLLKDIPHVRLFSSEYEAHTAYHLCVVQIDFEALGTKREEVMSKLQNSGIGTQVHYIPVYRHPFTKSGSIAEYFPEMEAYYSQALTLPLFYDLSSDDITHIVKILKESLNK